MALADDILLYGNKAQSKMLELGIEIEAQISKGDDALDQLERFVELLEFQLSLFGDRCPWTNAEKEFWINWMTERHELNEVAYSDFDPFVMPIVRMSDTSNGDYVTHPQLSTAVQALENVDSALDVRVTALENYDYSDLIPQSLIDDVAANKANVANLLILMDEAQDAILDLEVDFESHINNNSRHVNAGEKDTWNAKVSQSELTEGLEEKSDVDHGHTISEVDGLQDNLNNLQQQINNVPTPTNGNDGITPVISATIEEGEEFAVLVTGPAASPTLNFTLVKGEKGDPFAFDDMGTLAERDEHDAEAPGFIYLDTVNGNYYILDIDGWGDPIPFKGFDGWTPRLGVYTVNADKEVFEILGFMGGTGPEPQLPLPVDAEPGTVRFFLADSGIVTDAAMAKNVKGNKGEDGEKGDTFIVNAEGTDRSIYDAMDQGFAFLNTTTGKVSSKLSSTSGDWGIETQWTGEASVVPGPEGDSAYDVAVANGFVGTEAEWLDSLNGTDGEDGEDGAPGAPGADGSKYDVELIAHGFSLHDVLQVTPAGVLELWDETGDYAGIVVNVIDVDNFTIQSGGIYENVMIDEGDYFYAQNDGTIDTAVATDLIVIVGISPGVGLVKAALGGNVFDLTGVHDVTDHVTIQGANKALIIKSNSGRDPKLRLDCDGVDGDGRNYQIAPELFFGFYRGLAIKYSLNHLLAADQLAMYFRDNGNIYFGAVADGDAHMIYSKSQSALALGNTLGSMGNFDFIQGANIVNNGTGTGNIIKGTGFGLKGLSSNNFIFAHAPVNDPDYMHTISDSYLNAITTTNYLRNFGGCIVVGDDQDVNREVAANEYQTLYCIIMGNHNSALNTHHLFQFGTGLVNHYNNTDHGLWKYQPKFYFGNSNVEMGTERASFVIANGYYGVYKSNSLTHLASGWTQINTTNTTGFTGGEGGPDADLTVADVTPKAAFEVVSDHSGILFPRLSQIEIDAIDLGDLHDGMQLYNTTTEKMNLRQAGAWDEPGGGGGASHIRFRFNSSLYTEDEHLFKGILTTLTEDVSDNLTSTSYEARLNDGVDTYEVCADLAALQAWITTNVLDNADTFWIKCIVDFGSGTGTGENYFTYL